MYFVDGRWVEAAETLIHPEDRGYQFGDGVYEVGRVYQGKIYEWEAHYQRLCRSAQELQISIPWSSSELRQIASQLIEKNGLTETDAIVYLQVTRGSAPRQHDFPEGVNPVLSGFARKLERPLAQQQAGIPAALIPDIRWLRCDIKSLNLLGAVMAKQQAKERGAYEAILHRDGTVTEGSAANLFVVKEGTLYTHPANHLILRGITRQVVIELANQLSLPVREEPFDTRFLEQADEVFFTATTIELMPVISIDGKPVGNGQVGEVVRALQDAFAKTIR